MDWVRDTYGVSDADRESLYRYGDGGGKILKLMEDEKISFQNHLWCCSSLTFPHSPSLWPIADENDLLHWSKKEKPVLDSAYGGLVLMILNHRGEQTFSLTEKTDSDVWLKKQTVEPCLDEKSHIVASNSKYRGRKSLKDIPFSRRTFERVAGLFYVHGSVSRAISRADAPVIFRTRATKEENDIEHEAWIYNIRTSNAWDSDLAATITYFPHNGLTFGIIFGCQASTEQEIVRRLTLAGRDALHPFIVPGILLELERKRHVNVAKQAISEIETRIYQLNPRPDTTDIITQDELERLHREKRSEWLDMTYMRNCLISWRDQLDNVGFYLTEIQNRQMRSAPQSLFPISVEWDCMAYGPMHSNEERPRLYHLQAHCSKCSSETTSLHGSGKDVNEKEIETNSEIDDQPHDPFETALAEKTFATSNDLAKTSFKIRTRTQELLKEYDDLIRDCTMRIDGMSMATQWAQGETNMEIAKATSRDSKHMRSISLVTMVFLPGTFFAGMFSTSFFNWPDGDDQPRFSSYFWIYILITVICTMLTLGLWYYFNVFRHSIGRKKAEDAEVMSFV